MPAPAAAFWDANVGANIIRLLFEINLAVRAGFGRAGTGATRCAAPIALSPPAGGVLGPLGARAALLNIPRRSPSSSLHAPSAPPLPVPVPPLAPPALLLPQQHSRCGFCAPTSHYQDIYQASCSPTRTAQPSAQHRPPRSPLAGINSRTQLLPPADAPPWGHSSSDSLASAPNSPLASPTKAPPSPSAAARLNGAHAGSTTAAQLDSPRTFSPLSDQQRRSPLMARVGVWRSSAASSPDAAKPDAASPGRPVVASVHAASGCAQRTHTTLLHGSNAAASSQFEAPPNGQQRASDGGSTAATAPRHSVAAAVRELARSHRASVENTIPRRRLDPAPSSSCAQAAGPMPSANSPSATHNGTATAQPAFLHAAAGIPQPAVHDAPPPPVATSPTLWPAHAGASSAASSAASSGACSLRLSLMCEDTVNMASVDLSMFLRGQCAAEAQSALPSAASVDERRLPAGAASGRAGAAGLFRISESRSFDASSSAGAWPQLVAAGAGNGSTWAQRPESGTSSLMFAAPLAVSTSECSTEWDTGMSLEPEISLRDYLQHAAGNGSGSGGPANVPKLPTRRNYK